MLKQHTTVEQLLIDLRQHDWSVNWKTADALAELGEDAVPQLLHALEDTDGYVRNGAAIALGKIGNSNATQPLIRALRWHDDLVYEDDEDQEARTSAATALGKLRNDAACQALLAEFEKFPSVDSTLASYIVEALGEIGDPRAVHVMLKAIDSGDFELQKIAASALAKLGRDGIEELLRLAAKHDQPGRPYVIRALGTNSVKSAAPLLLKILNDSTEGKAVRCQAAEAIGRIGGSPNILSILLALLHGPDEVRTGALTGLGALRDSRAFSAIAGQLDNKHLRYAAVMALGDLGDARACELLIPMLSSGDDGLAYHAATALGKIGCQDALPSLIQLRERLEASDSPISSVNRVAIEEIIGKLQQTKQRGQVSRNEG